VTAVCGGGASAAIPGFNSTVYVTAAAVDGALTLLGLEPVAALLAPFIASEVYDLTTFCVIDPPADPGLTAQDLIDVTNFIDPTVSIPALAKVRQWFNSWYWYQVCHCTTTTTPAASTPSNPGGTSPNGGLPTSSVGAKCWDSQQDWPFDPPYQTIRDNVLLWPDGEPLHNNSGDRYLPKPLPQSITYIGIYNPSGTNQGDNVFIQIDWFDVTGHVIRTDKTGVTDRPPNHLTRTLNVTPPSNADSVQFGAGVTGATAGPSPTGSITLRVQMFCSGQSPITPNSPCCPPDPSVEQRLNQILGLITSIYQSLPTRLTSYAEGASHAGLSGSGTVTLASSSAIAIRVNLTTVPAYLGRTSGTPTLLFDAGWITPVTSEGPVSGLPIEWVTQLVPLDPLTVSVDYTLAAGVIASFLELTAGP
jgi:hypothetical protein